MNEIITGFIENQTCATICCSGKEGRPYCFSCFYVFNSAESLLYFKSSADAKHTLMLKHNPVIAGTILPDKLNKYKVKGIQLHGEILLQDHLLAKDAAARYHKRYPLAIAIKGEVIVIRLTEIKMTDNSLGFGKKISWKRFPALYK